MYVLYNHIYKYGIKNVQKNGIIFIWVKHKISNENEKEKTNIYTFIK